MDRSHGHIGGENMQTLGAGEMAQKLRALAVLQRTQVSLSISLLSDL